MKWSDARWLLLPASAAGALWCVFGGLTPGRAAFTVATGLAWFALSRRKVHSLDRETLGIPPRR